MRLKTRVYGMFVCMYVYIYGGGGTTITRNICIACRQVTRTKSKSGAVVKHQRMIVVYKSTSSVKGLFKSGATPLYRSLVTTLVWLYGDSVKYSIAYSHAPAHSNLANYKFTLE